MLFLNQIGIKKFGSFENKKCWQVIQDKNGPCLFCKSDKLIHEKEKKVIKSEYQNSNDKKWYAGSDLCIPWVNNKTAHLHIATDITSNKRLEQELESIVAQKTFNLTQEIIQRKQIQKTLVKKSKFLKQANFALKSMLDNREAEKRAVEENFFLNIKKYILPYIEEIENQNPAEEILMPVNIIKTAISQLMSPVSGTLFSKYNDLTPMEIKVADLVKQGKRSKDIGEFLSIAKSSVSTYRNNIRKKLGLLNKKTNLRVYLNSLE